MLILYTVWLSCACVTKTFSSYIFTSCICVLAKMSNQWLYRESCCSKKKVSKNRPTTEQCAAWTNKICLTLTCSILGTFNNNDLCSIQHGLHGFSQQYQQHLECAVFPYMVVVNNCNDTWYVLIGWCILYGKASSDW